VDPVNKWRLLLGLGLGCLTFLSALNVIYAILKGTQGAAIYKPYLIGEFIGEVNAVDYFWGTFTLTIGLLGLTTIFAFPPTMLVDHILNTAPKLHTILPDYPEIEALQTVQMNVLDQIQSSEETNAERLDNLTMQFQMYHKEVMAFMERQEDNARVLLATIPQKTDARFNELEQLIMERRENVVLKNEPTVIRKKVPKRSVSRNRVRTKKSSGFKVTWRRGL
jgi:hypothetical protein